ncbi:MAG: YncE family protein [Bacteroidota bacterium]|nr:YncE family protein [Bacteroidota bacterium]
MNTKILLFIALIITLSSCEDHFGEEVSTEASGKYENGLFIVNEGLYTHGSGSLSFYNDEFAEMENDIFYNANNRPLGDVPQSMTIVDTLGYVVINNSGKIEIVSLNTAISYGSISGLRSPRYFLPVSEEYAYVSDLYSDSLAVINLITNEISSYINISCSSEQMLKVDKKVFVANWSSISSPNSENNRIAIINSDLNQLNSYIEVVKEPNSMVLDKNNNLWVLCSGGYDNSEIPALIQINTIDNSIIKQIDFPINDSPNSLMINGAGDMLYFLNQNVYRMPITDNNIPSDSFIENDGHLFYALGVDPVNNDVYVSDAMDYQQNGMVYRYNSHGVSLDFERAGIIPGKFVFR